MTKKKNTSKVYQVRNPKTERYVKIDGTKHRILAVTKKDQPFANVPVKRAKSKK